MFMETFPVGCLACNCTILGCQETGEAIIIDPGDEGPKIMKIIEEQGLRVKYLVHTHAHFDHIGAAGELKQSGHGKILLHKGDDFLYDDLEGQGRMFGIKVPPKDSVDHSIEHKEQLEFGKHHLDIIHTPGHTPGSCSFLLKEQNILFTGDTLFRDSVGRTDFPGGDHHQLLDSIKNRLIKPGEDYQLIPGHGPSSNMAREVKSNPFLLGLT